MFIGKKKTILLNNFVSNICPLLKSKAKPTKSAKKWLNADKNHFFYNYLSKTQKLKSSSKN